MAIYLNDKIFKADPQGSKLEREYAAGLAKINELFDKFRIKGEPTSFIQIARKDEKREYSMSGKKQKRLPPIALPVQVPYYDDEMGATMIRYSTSPPQRNANGTLTYATKWIEFNEYMTITDKQKDLAWFLLFASNLVKRGVYQLVDVQAKYEGTYNEIITQKEVMDTFTSGDEDIVRAVAVKFLGDSVINVDHKELVVKVINWSKTSNKWNEVLAEIKKNGSEKLLKKERVSDVMWEDEPVSIMKCPAEIGNQELKAEASSLGIRLTVPPQTKDVLYSLVQHVKSKKTISVK